MTQIREQYLQFNFGSRWDVVKLDDHPDYRNGIEKLDQTKAVDFLAVLDDQTLYLIEVKDFRDHRIENQNRMTSGDLALEWGHKVRDSVACVVGAYRQSNRDEPIWDKCLNILHNIHKDVRIVLWLEYDSAPYYQKRRQVNASVEQNKLKKKFKWLTNKVLVANLQNNSLPDLTVQNLPHS